MNQSSASLCGVVECTSKLVARGLCGKHYQRWAKHGDPLFVPVNRGNRKPRPIITHRTCLDCSHFGPITEFALRKNLCRPCNATRQTTWKRANPDKVKASLERNAANIQRRELRRRATRNEQDPDVVEAYYNAHHGCCDICRGPSGSRDFNIDHNHENGNFRGLLCSPCNRGLGLFKDDPNVMLAAIAYLARDGVTPGDLLDLINATPKG